MITCGLQSASNTWNTIFRTQVCIHGVRGCGTGVGVKWDINWFIKILNVYFQRGYCQDVYAINSLQVFYLHFI